ncbi:hypothetical protein HUG17_6900 [Dermatophagoides farinae]|uniref:Uncharacterized protein n=1 Tax=Dermatophagoides farinae TaxID=6954 RepID=A0A9D4NR51_DERFA|nr:uncharacterized protein LOC124494722 [Dermatophagoides farinae]KAH7636694.1 hypothetical protein HUG17_6900 [Dermatophagoides farinae]
MKSGSIHFLILVLPVILANQNLTVNDTEHFKKSDLVNNSTKVDQYKEKPQEESLMIDETFHDEQQDDDLAEFESPDFESEEGIKTGDDYYNDYMTHKGPATTHKGDKGTTKKGGGATTHKGNGATTHKGGAVTTHKGGPVTTHKGGGGTTPHRGHNGSNKQSAYNLGTIFVVLAITFGQIID